MRADQTSLLESVCPACHYSLAAQFFFGEAQPLSTLGWPSSPEQAKAMPKHPLDYVQCTRCTHIWNQSFLYEAIPYSKQPNRMFNSGITWQGHLKTVRDIAMSDLPSNPTVIDIGCGEGHFVRGISEELNTEGRFIGFDPNFSPESSLGFEFQCRLFDPLVDIQKFVPDLLIMRHVLEHLTYPARFMDQLAWAANQLEKPVFFMAEVPCIDNALASNRLVDFFYEHPSQFTTESFQRLLNRGGENVMLGHGYENEVVFGKVLLGAPTDYERHAVNSRMFSHKAEEVIFSIRRQLKQLVAERHSIAIWGGTGKAAAFMNLYEVDAENFPLVVDSDRNKVGTFVPKTGQKIQYLDVLKRKPVDIIIVPSRWRVKDIVAEIQREGIVTGKVLVELSGQMVEA